MSNYFVKIKTNPKEQIHQTTSDWCRKEMTLISDEKITIGYSSGEEELDIFNSEKYLIIFDGQCYNETELSNLSNQSDELSTSTFSERIAILFERMDIGVFDKIRGKFTLLIYQKDKQTFYAARDHFGLKPLYYYHHENDLYVSNDKKILHKFIEKARVHTASLQHYFSFQYVPEPYSMNEDFYLVPAASYLKYSINKGYAINNYWKIHFNPIVRSEEWYVNKIRKTLMESVENHIDKDKLTGSYLSGGIDSSFVVSLAKEIVPNIKSFSVGFEREGFSEIDVAEKTAEKLGIQHISKIIDAEEYVAALPEIVWHLGEPLADPSCVPLYFVAKLAKEHVDIALSGEGADETFAGYNIYREPEALKLFRFIPKRIHGVLSQVADLVPDRVKGKSFLKRGTTPLKERYIGNAKIFEESEKKSFLKTYDDQVSYTQITLPLFDEVSELNPVSQMQYIDLHTWLPGDILLKAEQMAKANELDVRMPFLDINVFKLASEIPVTFNLKNNTTKYVLREAAKGIVPDHVLNRRKLGFPVPLRHWLRDELYDWARDIIKFSETDYLIDKQAVYSLLTDHYHGKRDNSRKIWTIIIFMIWHQLFIDNQNQDLIKEKTRMG